MVFVLIDCEYVATRQKPSRMSLRACRNRSDGVTLAGIPPNSELANRYSVYDSGIPARPALFPADVDQSKCWAVPTNNMKAWRVETAVSWVISREEVVSSWFATYWDTLPGCLGTSCLGISALSLSSEDRGMAPESSLVVAMSGLL